MAFFINKEINRDNINNLSTVTLTVERKEQLWQLFLLLEEELSVPQYDYIYIDFKFYDEEVMHWVKGRLYSRGIAVSTVTDEKTFFNFSIPR